MSDRQRDALEAARATLASHAGRLPRAAWITDQGIVAMPAPDPSWVARQRFDRVTVRAAAA